jgi:hypothetical protein
MVRARVVRPAILTLSPFRKYRPKTEIDSPGFAARRETPVTSGDGGIFDGFGAVLGASPAKVVIGVSLSFEGDGSSTFASLSGEGE